jgi:hypothetical protein
MVFMNQLIFGGGHIVFIYQDVFLLYLPALPRKESQQRKEQRRKQKETQRYNYKAARPIGLKVCRSRNMLSLTAVAIYNL